MKRVITAVFALALLAPLAAEAQELELTGNVGFVSDYYYRGLPQNSSSGSAGLDAAYGGLYLGTWAADVGDGNEVDVYAGYGIDIEGLSLSVGGTGYFYTDTFDETYLEANLGAAYGPLSVEFSIGEYDDQPEADNYTFLGITAEHEGLYATYGLFGGDDTFYAEGGDYFEAGYGLTVSGLDFGVAWIYGSEGLYDGDSDNTLIFGVSHTFDIGLFD